MALEVEKGEYQPSKLTITVSKGDRMKKEQMWRQGRSNYIVKPESKDDKRGNGFQTKEIRSLFFSTFQSPFSSRL